MPILSVGIFACVAGCSFDPQNGCLCLPAFMHLDEVMGAVSLHPDGDGVAFTRGDEVLQAFNMTDSVQEL